MRLGSIFAIAVLATAIAPSSAQWQVKIFVYNEGQTIFTEVPNLVDYDKEKPSPTRTAADVKTTQHDVVNFYGTGNTVFVGDFPGFSTYVGKRFVWDVVGCYEAQQDGRHVICTKSDDGSELYFDKDQDGIVSSSASDLLVNNDGAHAPRVRCEPLQLEKGKVYTVRAPGFEDPLGDRQMTIKIGLPSTAIPVDESELQAFYETEFGTLPLATSVGIPRFDRANGLYTCQPEINE